MDFRHLRALQAVAETGSFSAAADALNYTQPAVSRTVAALERELGAVLIERQARPLRLTDAGVALARHADELFALLSGARSEVEAIAQAHAGTVALGTFSSAGAAFVVDALRRFRNTHPGVSVSVAEGMPSSLLRQLRAGELDLAVVFDFPSAGENIGNELELHHLLDDELVVVLPRDHPLADHDRIEPSQLADEDWLLPDFGPDSPSLKLIARACAAAAFEPRIAFRVNDCQMTQAMVATGEGISILPQLMLYPLRQDVTVRPLARQTISRRVAAVRQPNRYLAPATAAFLSTLKRAASQHQATLDPTPPARSPGRPG
jgi:DNA-binding transcriptional LysR family regulator